MQLNKQHFLDLGSNLDYSDAESDLDRLCIHIFFPRHLQSDTDVIVEASPYERPRAELVELLQMSSEMRQFSYVGRLVNSRQGKRCIPKF